MKNPLGLHQCRLHSAIFLTDNRPGQQYARDLIELCLMQSRR